MQEMTNFISIIARGRLIEIKQNPIASLLTIQERSILFHLKKQNYLLVFIYLWGSNIHCDCRL